MSGKNLSRSEIDGKLRELKSNLDKLRRNYEQYFVGSRNRPPQNLRRQVERTVRELEQTQISNTSQRFRLRSLVQRFSSYRQKWNRIQRQIERGTYKPHQDRAKRRLEQKREKGQQGAEHEESAEERDDSFELEMEVEEVDLSELQTELEEMDEDGEFEKYVETEKMARSDFDEAEDKRQADPDRPDPSSSSPTGAGDEATESFESQPETEKLDSEDLNRRERIRNKQDELGLSGGTDKLGERRDKLERMRRSLEKDSENSSDESASSKTSRSTRREDSSRDFDKASQEPTEKLESLRSKLPEKGADREHLEQRKRDREEIERRRRRDKDRPDEDAAGQEARKKRQDRVIDRSSSRGSGDSGDGSSEDSEESSSDDDPSDAEPLHCR